MRIAFAAHRASRIGGVESYLATIVPSLRNAGHDVACWFETDDITRESILAGEPGIKVWTAGDRHDDAVRSLRAWAPDVLYVHGLTSPVRERELLTLAPAVCFAHSYYGTCVSGSKMHLFPAPRPCARTFGYECLAQYYPRRCGGLSPVTMLHQFRLQRDRLQLLTLYDRIVVASRHMAEEYTRHGLAEKVRVVSLPVQGPIVDGARETSSDSWQLLYLGRFEKTKGTLTALESAAIVARSTRRRVMLQISGEGSLSEQLRERARTLMGEHANLSVSITGWLRPDECVGAFDRADLLLVPSAWPEPFGMVGIEAGLRGLPSIAFGVGGIEEWLQDGVNGRITSALSDPNEFAAAIISCLTDPIMLALMQRQSVLAARRFSVAAHVKTLEAVLYEVAPALSCT